MKYILILLCLLSFACDKIEYQEEQYEEGRVSYMEFKPAYETFNLTINSEGEAELTTDTVDEEYILKFTCDHGEFQISSYHAKELFYKFRIDDEVIITFRQMDKVKYKDGKEIERDFHDWDFITANKLDRNGPKEQ